MQIERENETLLFDSFESGLAVIDLLLEYGADINMINEGHRTAYMIAGEPALRAALAERGAEVILQDENGRTALHREVDDENLGEIRKVLAEQPILVNLGKKYGETPLFAACFNEYSNPAPPPILEVLLDAGADVDARNNPWHHTTDRPAMVPGRTGPGFGSSRPRRRHQRRNRESRRNYRPEPGGGGPECRERPVPPGPGCRRERHDLEDSGTELRRRDSRDAGRCGGRGFLKE